jgi:2-polyprenyl-3-methyl-5-hydroxy-6-metoxy-1,4-benzoquinol methylase
MINTYIIIILDLMLKYIDENNIYNIDHLYHFMMSVYFGAFFIGMLWMYLCKYLFKFLNPIGMFVYTSMYDHFFGKKKFPLSTPNLFYNSLKKIESGSRILDFGCGNGICYSNQLIKELVINNNLSIQGIDIDKIYIDKCIKRIKKENLESNIKIRLQDVLAYKEDESNKYDYIIFSESAPLISNNLLKQIISHMKINLLKPNGKIIFINNLTENPTPIMLKLKPLLKYIVMIDFGRVLTKQEFKNLASNINKNVEFNLIAKMNIKNILNFFNLGWTYYFWRAIGIKNYDVEQYEIRFF